MKPGVRSIPALKELKKAYASLLHDSPAAPGCREISLFSQWSRFDPRLSEIWVKYVIEHWREIHPILLRESILRQPWPGAAAVLLEFVKRAVTAAAPDEAKLFRLWKDTVTEGFGKANWEQFYIGQRRIAGKAMFDDARFALAEYKKWGYLGREIPFNKQLLPGRAPGRTHSIEPKTRLDILKALLKDSPRISTEMYWAAIGKCVSRRQAERDLEVCGFIRPQGRTKGRYFTAKK